MYWALQKSGGEERRGEEGGEGRRDGEGGGSVIQSKGGNFIIEHLKISYYSYLSTATLYEMQQK